MLDSDVIKNGSTKISIFSMLISAISMGCVGVFVSLLQSFSIFTIVLLRGIFGTLFLSLFMIRTKSFSRKFLKDSIFTHWKLLLIIGLINPLVIYLYFLNISISGYGLAAFLLYTNGIFVILILMIDKTEKISKINVLSFIIAIIGVAIIMEFWEGFQLTWGIILGLLSGITLALLIFSKKKIYVIRNQNLSIINKNNGNFDIFLAWWPTMFLIIIFLPISGFELINLTWIDLIYSLLLGLIPTALAFTLYNIGVKNDRGGNIIILAYIEPVVATICEFFIRRVFSITLVIGGALILIANILILKFSR